MLKVNEEKLLSDHKALEAKRFENLAVIEKDATAYAVAHGYNEEKTAKFVAFTQEIQGNGLSEEENAKLEILGSYIEEVAEEEVADETAAEIPAATVNGVISNV